MFDLYSFANIWKARNNSPVEQVQNEYKTIKLMRPRDQQAKVARMEPDVTLQTVKLKRNTTLSVVKAIILPMDAG